MHAKQVSPNEILIFDTAGELFSGINFGYYRPWIFPLISTEGTNILRELPPDHGFHNGGFFGHYPVISGITVHNFWGAPPFRKSDDSLAEHLGRIISEVMAVEEESHRIVVRLSCCWVNSEEATIIKECRRYDFFCTESSRTLRTTSILNNQTESDLIFKTTKFSGHAFRLSSEISGNSELTWSKREEPKRISGFSSLDNSIAVQTSNLCVTFSGSEDCEVFARSYGLVALNPFSRSDVQLPPRGSYRFFSEVSLFPSLQTR